MKDNLFEYFLPELWILLIFYGRICIQFCFWNQELPHVVARWDRHNYCERNIMV
jgi:hypothetical protein